ncbi:MAG: hypothetical protein HC803_08070 [Saprospiraceae bacterium]|nr:hypothetical protein [Saprospiraceae bacterium]
MKNLFTLIALVFVTSFAFGQTEKTLVKTFNLQGNTSVALDFSGNGNVTVEEWGETTLRIHMNISLENTNVNMLKYLITQGRYNLVLQTTDTGIQISSPGRNQAVVINKAGDVLTETVTYTVFVPRNVEVKILNKEPVQEPVQAGDK